jgi:general secretion pathway protein L
VASPAEALLAPLREVAGRTGALEFLRWWSGELAAIVPTGWRERFSTRGVAYVALKGGRWRISRLSGEGLVELGRSSEVFPEGADQAAAFRRAVADAVGGAANLWLVLSPEEVLIRTAVLPLAAEEALRDAVGFELDRLTPLAADQACFDCRVTGRDATAQTLELQLAVTARGPVDARIAQLREHGATVLGVGIDGDVGATPRPFNLLSPDQRDRPATSRAIVVARILAALAVFLAIAALVYPLWQKRDAVIALQPRLESAKAGADVADRLAKEIEKLAAEHNFLVARKQGQYPAVVLLEDLSRLLPDTTWVQQLDIKAGPKVREVQIAGETGSSSQLVELLEKSGLLVNASFKSPLTKGVTPGTERFLLAAEVKPRDPPEPLPESALIAPAKSVPAVSPDLTNPAAGAVGAGGPPPAAGPQASPGAGNLPAAPKADDSPAPVRPAAKG